MRISEGETLVSIFSSFNSFPMFSLDGDLVLMRASGRPSPGEAAGRLWKLEDRVGGGEIEIEPKGGTVLEEELVGYQKQSVPKEQKSPSSQFSLGLFIVCIR